ncbi:hypothetical protein CPT_Maja_094 [Burkholderia phage Maja]|uniref:Uncharacterized protein n=1 Tax=Burkholderia phage Maja TaxID=2767571 RepID=A0A7S6R7I1_9CAUD|nr:hypothetical protein CPT_Maja_094 [Burkholderia phage Maja]
MMTWLFVGACAFLYLSVVAIIRRVLSVLEKRLFK